MTTAEGRARKKDNGSFVCDYYLKDHLGNTRVTFTTENEEVIYLATMETAHQAFEEEFFINTEMRETNATANYTIDPTTDEDQVIRTRGNDPLKQLGVGKVMQVMRGDQVDMEAFAYHYGGYTDNGAVSNTAILTALVGAVTGAAPLGTETAGIAPSINGYASSIFVGTGGSTSSPRAYLNYILFDRDFNYLDAGFTQVSNTANTDIQLTLSKTIEQNGYIYVYVSNESNTSFDVFFDDLRITHTKGKVLQEDHYYPFGANISALSSTAPLSKPNNFKYNGFEEQTDFDLGWYDYQARFYDPQLGRFMQVDPAADFMRRHSPYNYAFDNPIRFIDPDGMLPSMAGGCPPGVDCRAIERKTQEVVENVNNKIDNTIDNIGGFLNDVGRLMEDISFLGQGVVTGRLWFRITGDAPSGDDKGATDIEDIPDGSEIIEINMSTSENGDSNSFGDFMNLMNGSTPQMQKGKQFNDMAKDLATTVPKVNEGDFNTKPVDRKNDKVGIKRIMEQVDGSFTIRVDSFPSYMEQFVIKAPDTTFTAETGQKKSKANGN